MRVCLPFSLMNDCALFASSGRTKFADRVELTTRSPASIAARSSVAQYLPRRYSRTNTGTLAPTLTLRTRSLRTTFPANTVAALRSRSGTGFSSSEGDGDLDLLQDREFLAGRGVEQVDAHGLLRRFLDDHQGHRVRGDRL